jgi:peptidoglycan/LPS O-acetylase OafA/YrhL
MSQKSSLPQLAKSVSMALIPDTGAAAYHAVNAVVALALTIMLASGVYRLVEVPGRRAIRSLADRVLRLRHPSSMNEQAAPAE